MRIDNVSGYFDVREFNAKKAREERNIKGDDQVITFTLLLDGNELPKELAEFAKQYEKDGHIRYAVKFKIGQRCKWFCKSDSGNVVACERPTNSELDGVRYRVWIDYRTLHGDPKAMEACGYWVNGIVIEEDSGSMFADLNIATEPQAEPQAEQLKETPTEQPLPF